MPAAASSNGDDLSRRKATLLEKKWTTVMRLQKKIEELERTVGQLEEQAKAGGSARRPATRQLENALPRGPALHTLKGHRSPISALAFHPNFNQIASASEDATIKLWNYESGDFERTLKGHTNAVQDIQFNPSGTLLVSCSADLTIKLWDVETTFECIKTFNGHDHNVSSVRFMENDDEVIVSASRDKTIKLWNITNGYCITTLVGHSDWVRCVTVSAHLIASASSDHTVRIWNTLAHGKRTPSSASSSSSSSSSDQSEKQLRGHSHVVQCIAFAPKNFSLTSSTKKETKNDAKDQPSEYVASGSRDKSIKLWHIPTERCVATFTGHSNWVQSIVFHPNGKFLLSVSDDKTLRIWDIKQNRCMRTIDAHTQFVTSLAFNKSDPHVITGCVDNTIKVWPCQ
eukprot:CAMPEP_0201545214 /NCGR_PEP_ID=MMETSP0173_2-20130828/1746_1 /ASSEMBLY_ACC=CAM_ASM_000268 /TAXON_ID=218659 /ORGANISM="Vexillifera sp., Strain DIVA3 564/2" /LENGTH=399 /DNA_ID=CAMNT_0047953551 /DNA_START=84 /DNA_END=1283 /DNA_ORIENTATION=-